MADAPGPWAAPSGEERPVPRYGELAPEGWTPPAAPPPAWAPPPKPGLIPLRPLGVGEILGAAFDVIRRNPGPTFGFALLISFLNTLIVGALVGGVVWWAANRELMAASSDLEAISAGTVLVSILVAVAAAVIQLALGALPQGIVALETAHSALGERRTLRELWRLAAGRLLPLVAWTLLVAAVALAAVALVAVPLVGLGFAGGTAGIVAAVGLGLLAVAGIAVASVWLGTKLEFVPALIVVERLPIGAAIRRSWRLTGGSFWRIFGITLLMSVIVQIAASIVTAPVQLLFEFAAAAINPNQDLAAQAGMLVLSAIVLAVVTTVVGAVVLVPQSATPALLYLDQRIRKEGFDVELQQVVERRAAGEEPPDPFRVQRP